MNLWTFSSAWGHWKSGQARKNMKVMGFVSKCGAPIIIICPLGVPHFETNPSSTASGFFQASKLWNLYVTFASVALRPDRRLDWSKHKMAELYEPPLWICLDKGISIPSFRRNYKLYNYTWSLGWLCSPTVWTVERRGKMRKRVLFRVLLQTIVRQLSARMMFNANNEKRSLERPSLNLPTRVKPLPKRRFPTLFSDRCFRFLRSVNQASYKVSDKGWSAIWDLKVRMLCIALCFCNESDWIKRVASCVCVWPETGPFAPLT